MAPIEGKQSHVTVNTLMVLRKKFQSDNAYKEINRQMSTIANGQSTVTKCHCPAHDEHTVLVSMKNRMSKRCAMNGFVIKLLESGRSRPRGHP